MKFHIAYLYPELLNIYGDRGNIITLVKRCHWRGIGVKVTPLSLANNLVPNAYDLFFGGGGQDRQQLLVAKDLQKKAKVLHQEAQRGVPMLTICGTYQLFGHYFKTHEGVKIPGISIFDAYTVASDKRKIGNVVIKPTILGLADFNLRNKRAINCATPFQLVGFENHSGNTFIQPSTINHQPSTIPLGQVIRGFGNNGQDKSEGAIYNNVIGTYLHGPILPKNPYLADWLIQKALEVKYHKPIKLKPLDDSLEWQAHQKAVRLTKSWFA